VLCLDQASMSFSDLYLHSANSPATKSTPGGGREHSVDGAKFSIASEEASQEVYPVYPPSPPPPCLASATALEITGQHDGNLLRYA
jgi:hypothetical protein